jgi:integrase
VRQGFFEREQFEDVRTQLPEVLRPSVTFAYLTGWRIPSEVLRLKWARIDRVSAVIRLEPGETKDDSGRTFPYDLLPEFREVIEAQWAERERLKGNDVICPFVFHRNGKPIRSFRYGIVDEGDLRHAVGKLGTLATGTKMGQSAGLGRIAKIDGRRK